MVPQMPCPFPTFSAAQQDSFLSQPSWEVLNSFQIRQNASLYPIQFEETVAEGNPKE
jgi:hypothetical protein